MSCELVPAPHATHFRHSIALSPLAESLILKMQSTNLSKRYANATPVVRLLRSKARCLVVATHVFLAKRSLPDCATSFLHR
jgi:hypothetical protein